MSGALHGGSAGDERKDRGPVRGRAETVPADDPAGGRAEAVPADDPHRRPEGVDDATVAAVGRLTEALEWVERARGRLYDFHHMIGHADALLGEAVDRLAAAGHGSEAERLREELVGRNVLEGRWTFQAVEEFDVLFWQPFRAAEQAVRDALVGGRQHVHEAELKAARITWGRAGHEWRPDRAR